MGISGCVGLNSRGIGVADETDVNKDAAISNASGSGPGMALWKQESWSFGAAWWQRNG